MAFPELLGQALYEIKHPDGPVISVFRSPEEAATAMSPLALNIIREHPNDTILGATGNTFLKVWPIFIREAVRLEVDLRKLQVGHLDNYVWRPEQYPHGPGPEDFAEFMRQNLIIPAGIPMEHFHPIDGYTSNPNLVALLYQSWLNTQQVRIAFFGLGPVPEVHLGYMNAYTPADRGMHHVHLSPTTVKRNLERGENVPNEAITAGPSTIAKAEHKIVMAFNKPGEITRALVEPKSPRIVASMLRGLPNVHFFIDEASARPLQAFR